MHNQDPTDRVDRTPVSVVGLGMMGSALAGTFVAAGHPTMVSNRSRHKADDLVARGATAAATVAEAVAASPLVIVCVSDYETARELLAPVGDVLSGRVLVNLTSGTPEQARDTAAWAGERGIDYLDGAIMAIPAGIGQPETLLFYGGSRAAFEAHLPTLAALGGDNTYLGSDPGVPLLYDLGLLGMLWTATAGHLHALALVGTAGVAPADFEPFASAWLEHVIAPDLADTAAEVTAGEYATDVSSLAVNQAAIDHLVQTSRAAGVSTDVMTPIQALIDRQVAAGRGAESLASLVELLRQPEPISAG